MIKKLILFAGAGICLASSPGFSQAIAQARTQPIMHTSSQPIVAPTTQPTAEAIAQARTQPTMEPTPQQKWLLKDDWKMQSTVTDTSGGARIHHRRLSSEQGLSLRSVHGAKPAETKRPCIR
jgi:hypothetical protein